MQNMHDFIYVFSSPRISLSKEEQEQLKKSQPCDVSI